MPNCPVQLINYTSSLLLTLLFDFLPLLLASDFPLFKFILTTADGFFEGFFIICS